MRDSADPARRYCADLLAGRVSADQAVDTSRLLEIAETEGVAALLAHALQDSPLAPGLPIELASALRHAARVEAMRELARLTQARDVLTVLADAGVRVLVLKGTALAYWLYPSAVYRPRCDLDLLVPNREEASRAAHALRQAGYGLVDGVSAESSAEFEIALARADKPDSPAVDLHWRLVNHASLARGFAFDELWLGRRSIDRLHPYAHGLARAYALAHALLHRITNYPTGKQDRLIWLYDIHLLSGGCVEADWQEFRRVCRMKSIATPCLDGLRACRHMFGTAIPSAVEKDLEEMARAESWHLGAMLDSGGRDRSHLAALPWTEKIGWLGRKLFPSPDFMRFRYGAKGASGLLRAYLTRWWVGLKRGVGG